MINSTNWPYIKSQLSLTKENKLKRIEEKLLELQAKRIVGINRAWIAMGFKDE